MSEEFLIEVFAISISAILITLVTFVAKKCYCKDKDEEE